MSLATGKEIHGYAWDVLPIAEEVINRVHELALEENQPLITNNFKYEWRLDEEQVIEEDEESEGEQNGEEIEDALLNHRPPVSLLQAIEGEEESEDESNDDRD